MRKPAARGAIRDGDTMTTATSKSVTDLLVDWGNGKQGALDSLIPLVYGQLHRLASRYLRRERRDHTLQTTALVHEAYLKLVDQRHANWENRVQFFAVASQVMRHILVDYARSHNAAKRGGDYVRISLDDAMIVSKEKSGDLMVLDEALNKLEAVDPQQSRVVELRVFGGLSVEETAEALGLSSRTVKREWSMAKAWLHRQIKDGDR
jgi:RNA polymerase sigma-70 factor, ECF subfamily